MALINIFWAALAQNDLKDFTLIGMEDKVTLKYLINTATNVVGYLAYMIRW